MSCEAQVKNAKTETVKVNGNCEMCKKTIEKSANKRKVSNAEWNVETKLLTITFDSTKTSSDAILKDVAYAGYDNERFLAPDEAYEELHGCCQYEREGKTEAVKNKEHGQHEMHNADTTKKADNSVSEATNPLSDVFTAYFEVKDALAKDDGVNASKHAATLFKAIGDAPMDKMAAGVHTTWMKYQKELLSEAKQIKGSKEIDSQRENFIILSKKMYEVMKVAKMDVAVYYDFCPMADDGNGATWLSLEKTISNPYMGKSMPTCGKVQETIK